MGLGNDGRSSAAPAPDAARPPAARPAAPPPLPRPAAAPDPDPVAIPVPDPVPVPVSTPVPVPDSESQPEPEPDARPEPDDAPSGAGGAWPSAPADRCRPPAVNRLGGWSGVPYCCGGGGPMRPAPGSASVGGRRAGGGSGLWPGSGSGSCAGGGGSCAGASASSRRRLRSRCAVMSATGGVPPSPPSGSSAPRVLSTCAPGRVGCKQELVAEGSGPRPSSQQACRLNTGSVQRLDASDCPASGAAYYRNVTRFGTRLKDRTSCRRAGGGAAQSGHAVSEQVLG